TGRGAPLLSGTGNGLWLHQQTWGAFSSPFKQNREQLIALMEQKEAEIERLLSRTGSSSELAATSPAFTCTPGANPALDSASHSGFFP
ncbi:hypothetical protein, partial [Chitinophaga sp.]|uniref:hypothetical protein n=1 Tax=Chitinophaga sp. TaxID=1869181 RepID=UPI002D050A22